MAHAAELMRLLPEGPVLKPPPWNTLRKRVYERDGGVCYVCNEVVPWERYECGHMVDRSIGGPDCLENLVCMCGRCNAFKPLHDTREEFNAWVEAGGWSGSLMTSVYQKMLSTGFLAEGSL